MFLCRTEQNNSAGKRNIVAGGSSKYTYCLSGIVRRLTVDTVPFGTERGELDLTNIVSSSDLFVHCLTNCFKDVIIWLR